MLAYALLLTWNLEPHCDSVSLQSERGREGGGGGGGGGEEEEEERRKGGGGGEGGREGGRV